MLAYTALIQTNISIRRLGAGGSTDHADGATSDASSTVRLGVEDDRASDDTVVTIKVENIVTLVNNGLALVVSIYLSEIT